MAKNKDIFIVLIRLFLGYIFFSAGVCKLTQGQFGQLIGPPWLEETLAKHGLGLFAQVVAVCQVVCGSLLMSQRFSVLGAVMLVPMNVAILAVTVSMNWTGTPYINAIFLALNFILLFLERQKFMFLFKPNTSHTHKPTFTDKLGQDAYSWIGLAFCLAIMVAARYSTTLTNSFALLIFICFAFSILRTKLFHSLDKMLLLIPFLAMAVVTYADLHTLLTPFLLFLIAVEGSILAVRVIRGRRLAKEPDLSGSIAV